MSCIRAKRTEDIRLLPLNHSAPSGLHLPWAVILDDQLKPGPHTARVRLLASKTSSKTALRVFHLLLN